MTDKRIGLQYLLHREARERQEMFVVYMKFTIACGMECTQRLSNRYRVHCTKPLKMCKRFEARDRYISI